jgi:AcrR family transcriptional regulator
MAAAHRPRTQTPERRTKRHAANRTPSPHARDRIATQERVLGAVGQVLARDGFAAIGINAIAREAGVDKVLIYRYFGGLDALLRAWGASGKFWPSFAELLGDTPEAVLSLPLADRYAVFFDRFVDALRARPLTIEIMAAEIQERNQLTAILEDEREQWGAQAERIFGGEEFERNPHLKGITLLLVAGVQYLLIRARKIRVFGGLDLKSDGDWEKLKGSVRAMAKQVLGGQ